MSTPRPYIADIVNVDIVISVGIVITVQEDRV